MCTNPLEVYRMQSLELQCLAQGLRVQSMSVCDKWTLIWDPGQELALTEPTSPLQHERLKEVTSAKRIGPTRPRAGTTVEELLSGVWQATNFREQFSHLESEKQWKVHMEFILCHLSDYRDPPGIYRTGQLLSLSMVWASHFFLGYSYNKDLLDNVMEMADDVEVADQSQFTTRSELMKKHQS
ncbi:LOW QUALITY PROTEIN: CDKN2AIP N-terminal-like protein [Phocoena sinus]|uniref:LOW QUALITY PROTEIN: CDKN2AIP N-terminal-like protein n=1 Tax=Phocoena sinus TaxID=42100 RepID=UPI0013C4E2EB|nr:LOW QUALITY PROTEIN: CDKN2AIP N-terminal-like protein [Phocoena sinus]